MGDKSLLTLNVMSRHTIGPDTLIGQCILSVAQMQQLYSGKKLHISLPIQQLQHVVYDTSGGALKLSPAPSPMGWLSLSVNIPSIYENMCGWFWDIKSNMLGVIYGEKVWVVLHEQRVRLCILFYDRVH